MPGYEPAGSAIQVSDRARLEATSEGQLLWLEKATAAIEESVRIFRELGVHEQLAASLLTASNRYGDRASLETTGDKRLEWLHKAKVAIEDSVSINRVLGVRGVLAKALGALCRRHIDLAQVDQAMAARHVAVAREVVDDARALVHEIGDQRDLRLVLRDTVLTRLEQGRINLASLDRSELIAIADEGLSLASSLQDDPLIEFFRQTIELCRSSDARWPPPVAQVEEVNAKKH